MAVPKFNAFLNPLLLLVSDGKEWRIPKEVQEPLALRMGLTDEDRSQLIGSGKPVYVDRIGWAGTYLHAARVLERTARGVFRITDRGRALLSSAKGPIDLPDLKQFPEYVEFKRRERSVVAAEDAGPPNQVTALDDALIEQSPEEALQHSHDRVRRKLADELLEAVRECDPAFFERLVVEVLVKMGYGGTLEDAGRAVGKSGDGGIDGIIKEDRLGLDAIYIQAKRWNGANVNVGAVREFAGALQEKRARKGVFMTTSSFTKDARAFVQNIDSKIVLIDGPALAELMIDYGVGVSTVATYEIKRIDGDYFA